MILDGTQLVARALVVLLKGYGNQVADTMPEQWELLIEEALNSYRPEAVGAHTFLKDWSTAARPVLLACDDDNAYVVKGKQNGRMLVNDQVIARVGNLMGAPVGSPALVDVPQELVTAEPQMQHMEWGVSHGSRFIPNCSEREAILHTGNSENRPRFALLAVLYGLVKANDHQFVYDNSPPHLVHSVDHGHHFPNGPNWSVGSLESAGSPKLDEVLSAACRFTSEETRAALDSLGGVTDKGIARVVVVPPADWGLTDEERPALARYLGERRDALLGGHH